MCLRICSCQEEIVQPHTTEVAEEGMTNDFKAEYVVITASLPILILFASSILPIDLIMPFVCSDSQV